MHFETKIENGYRMLENRLLFKGEREWRLIMSRGDLRGSVTSLGFGSGELGDKAIRREAEPEIT